MFLNFVLIIIFCLNIHGLSAENITAFPLEIRNQHPPFLIFLEPYPLSASVMAKGRSSVSVDVVQANSTQYKKSIRATAMIDLETTRTSIKYHFGLGRNLEAGTEISAISFTKGIGDGGITLYHKSFGFPEGNEILYNNYSFKYDIREYDKTYFKLKPSTGLGDAVFYLKYGLLDETKYSPAISTAIHLKLPTGNLDEGTGSGKPDGAFSLLLKKTFSLINFYLTVTGVSVANPFKNSLSRAGSYGSGVFTSEYKYSSSLSILIQYDYKMSPYRSSLNQLASPASIISIGLNLLVADMNVIQLSFSEDLTHNTVPNITGQFSWKKFMQ